MTEPIVSPQLDPNSVAQQAEEIAAKKIEAMKEGLIQGLMGQNRQDAPPESWGQLRQEMHQTQEETIQEAEKRIVKRLESEKQKEEEQQKQTIQQQKAQMDREYAQVTNEWREAVADGLIPPLNPEIDKKIQGGVQYSQLTPDEKQDPGLLAWNEAFQLHSQLKREGKSSSFYRTVDKFYNKQPAGASAPVFGGSVSSQPAKDDYTYEEIHAATRKASKFR